MYRTGKLQIMGWDGDGVECVCMVDFTKRLQWSTQFKRVLSTANGLRDPTDKFIKILLQL